MFCWDQINWDILELPVIPQSRKINADTVQKHTKFVCQCLLFPVYVSKTQDQPSPKHSVPVKRFKLDRGGYCVCAEMFVLESVH